ncbi:methionine synthase [Coprobacter tertius]|uniref:Methionine synthase n=1 Tax=Coprobacter tertius TaxID=2944915 RepID=A0ABT1MH47_9BACT|nr:methionine synthase [Coprobacter tertius]MCP9611186.1 methionine synthase [Coprobacter tertius]
MKIEEIIRNRILILDGAMGTMIQKYNLTENDYRGSLFSDIPAQLKGNNDLLCLTRPQIIREIHEKYLLAGADIIETNTFNATSVSMADYGMQPYVTEINKAAARIAREIADEYTGRDPLKPRFVAGSVGPTNKTCSMSPDVNNPAYRTLTYDELASAYTEQIVALLEGKIDLLLIETIFDTLNAKAALYAADVAMRSTGIQVPVMLSVTLADSGGRTLSGQTLEAFIASVQHFGVFSIGLNCSFGAKDMKPYLKQLSAMAPCYVSAYPNAGLPNRFGQYDETPEKMAGQIKEYIDERLVNIIGGCCGTTPDHIACYSSLIERAEIRMPALPPDCLWLSGLERLEVKPENNFVNVGERCNVAGSRKFLRLINEKKYEEALEIARSQVENGAQVIDINMDDAMLDAKAEMVNFLNLIASEPEITRVPVMIDSSKWEVIEAGLKCVQGKPIVNSISLKEGEAVFLEHALSVKRLGAAVVVMAFDEKGQADTFARKIEVCHRAYNLLTKRIGFDPQDIIFDPNVLAIATGIDEHVNYAVDFIEATAWIKKNLPGAKVSGGVSNLSFSFRGNNYIREAMHSVFLYHAIRNGMDMGIVNPSTAITYDDIPADVLEIVEDVVLNRRSDATERIIELADRLKGETDKTAKKEKKDERAGMTLDERLEYALIKGHSDGLEIDLEEAMKVYGKAVKIIDGPLMSGMNKVGELFGAGKMFLPQVVKTARTMKRAVAILQPYIEAEKDASASSKAGKYLLATVKGDVHDIGKNIVGVVLSCNNYDVIDLGVMVPTEKIVETAIREKVDYVGLSGLITPSLEEMCNVADEMERAGLHVPLMIGGATTSKLHTAVKIAPRYSGPVIHVKDASQNPLVASQLASEKTRRFYLDKLKEEQDRLRRTVEDPVKLIPLSEACNKAIVIDWQAYTPVKPPVPGKVFHLKFSVQEVRKYINWIYFFNVWRINGKFTSVSGIDACEHCKVNWLASFPEEDRAKAAEAMQLYKEANRLLDKLEIDEYVAMEAVYGIFEAVSKDSVISLRGTDGREVIIPCLRQQIEKKNTEAAYYSLADFVRPSEKGESDYVGAFAVTSGQAVEERISYYNKQGDSYNALLLQSLSDRLSEAATELLHYKVRKELWGYTPDEEGDPAELLKEHYQGIRPAIAYPSLPDQSLSFELGKLIPYSQIGVSLTENGAMSPASTVSGLMIAHPQSVYFHIGKIDEEQRKWYAGHRRMTVEESLKWLSV